MNKPPKRRKKNERKTRTKGKIMNQESGGREGNQYNANTTFKYDVIVFNARVASGGWVPRGQWDATAITPQCGRTPTGLSTRNPATSPPPPPAPSRTDLRVGNPAQPIRLQSPRPRGLKPEAPSPTAALKAVEVPLCNQLSGHMDDGANGSANINLVGITRPPAWSLDQVIRNSPVSSCSCCPNTEAMA